MAQQNKYRDLDKNVYDLYNINQKYTKPITYIGYSVGSVSSLVITSGSDNTVKVDISNEVASFKSNLITIISIGFSTTSVLYQYFQSSINYFGVTLSVPSNFSFFAIGGYCPNDNITNTGIWLFADVNYRTVTYRCKNNTSPANANLIDSHSLFAVYSKNWIS